MMQSPHFCISKLFVQACQAIFHLSVVIFYLSLPLAIFEVQGAK